MHTDSATIIGQAVQVAGLTGYVGSRALGGGEVNETYVLKFEDGTEYILRIARDTDQTSLKNEAHSLSLLHLDHVPQVVFFDPESRIDDRMWILETYVAGAMVKRLNLAQFSSLGNLLAGVHRVQAGEVGVDVWQFFLNASKSFGNEQALLNHPDEHLRQLILRFREYVQEHQSKLELVVPSLMHGDATPSNVLADGDMVGLIDWEFSVFADPMAEFSTIYYDDMEYNRGKWRVHITPEERDALFSGYEAAGGKIDVDRVQLWMNVDKIGAAAFLYWRINGSVRATTAEQLARYQLDLENIISSLEKSL